MISESDGTWLACELGGWMDDVGQQHWWMGGESNHILTNKLITIYWGWQGFERVGHWGPPNWIYNQNLYKFFSNVPFIMPPIYAHQWETLNWEFLLTLKLLWELENRNWCRRKINGLIKYCSTRASKEQSEFENQCSFIHILVII